MTIFLLWEEGVPAYQRSQEVPPLARSEVLAPPAQVYDPPPYAPATDEWGPPGPVSLVFRGRLAREGLTGEVADPWYAVSARTGEYRRLAAPTLDRARGRLALAPQGTAVAWARPGGVATYDTMTGESTDRRVPGVTAGTPLVWSPDASRLALGTDPVRLLEPGTGSVRTLPLPGAGRQVSAPAWTTDGRWISVVTPRAVVSYALDGDRVRRFGAELGALREPAWNADDVLAGAHPITDPRHTVLRVVHPPAGGSAPVRVGEENPGGLVIERFLGWSGERHAVLSGLRPETGAIEQAMMLSLEQDSVQPYMELPTLGDNWVGASTLSVAADMLEEPSRAFGSPPLPWSPVAKLLLSLLVATFPVVYYLFARRPRAR